jgi:DNA processing protein
VQPGDAEFPEKLQARLMQKLHTLYVCGASLADLLERPRVAIVGSRKVSSYGKAVTTQLARELAELGVVVVSGLAIGIDGLAHGAAVEAGGQSIAVLPAGCDRIYPAGHANLAERIIEHGGALVSEYSSGSIPYKQNFIARNRIVAGLSDAVLITEAAEKSGSLHTARFALEQGVDVLCVPGNITSATSRGTNTLIKAGAAPATDVDDVLHVLGLERRATITNKVRGSNAHEQLVLDVLQEGITDGAELLSHSKLDIAQYNQVMTMLEIRGKIRPLGNNQWAVY